MDELSSKLLKICYVSWNLPSIDRISGKFMAYCPNQMENPGRTMDSISALPAELEQIFCCFRQDVHRHGNFLCSKPMDGAGTIVNTYI